MKLNPEKSHLLLSFKIPKKAYFGKAQVESSSTEKLLGIQIDFDLTFDKRTFSIRIVLCGLTSCSNLVKQPQSAQSSKDRSIETCLKLAK